MRQLVQLEQDQAKFGDKGAKIIALAVQDKAGAAESATKTKATFPIVADTDHHVADQYGVFDLLTGVHLDGDEGPHPGLTGGLVPGVDPPQGGHRQAHVERGPGPQALDDEVPRPAHVARRSG